jgi:hypothetical protein
MWENAWGSCGAYGQLRYHAPSWFLVAERMIVPETQRYMAARMKAKIKTHAVDYTPSVTAPGTVVDIIRDAIRTATGN